MSDLPVLIIGAGVSGLLLAQHLKKQGIPYEIFERDTSFTTRGVGWGLTLHWSLDPLRSLIPDDLVEDLPYAYADRIAVEKGILAKAPYYDLTTGARIAETKSDALKVRVTRDRLRHLLAKGLDIQWGKSFHSFQDDGDSVTVTFDDGGKRTGRLLVGADGASSRVRRALHPEHGQTYHLPVNVTGIKLIATPEQVASIRELDPYYFSGVAHNNTFLYASILDAPGSNRDSGDTYTMQVSVSWEPRPGLLGREEPLKFPESQDERRALIHEIADTWTEPFKSFIHSIPKETEIQVLVVQDYIPPLDFKQKGRVTLIGDSVHAMAMYRGEGANHAIYDIYEFSKRVTPHLVKNTMPDLRNALNEFEETVAKRTHPAVMASRRACLDAHDFERVNDKSPLFLKREPWVEFTDAEME
ncbi:FAD binding domain-containing protein [Xylariaceae sp. FL0255]|nr:FAD binding domain-containing protein [Xylariaceae sp. FL0255]